MPARIAASVIGTFRSYQLLLMTQSHLRSSCASAAESLASIATAVARSSDCAFATAFALSALRPAIPTRSTPGLARRSGTVDCAIAPYPPRTITFNDAIPEARSRGPHLPFSSAPTGSSAGSVTKIAHPTRMRPTLTANAGPYPSHCAEKPPSSGPKIEPNPWTALYAPKAWARPFAGARWETHVEPATLRTAQQSPTPAWRTKARAKMPAAGIETKLTRKNEPNKSERPRAAYTCGDALLREAIQRPTYGYAAMDMAWLPMYT